MPTVTVWGCRKSFICRLGKAKRNPACLIFQGVGFHFVLPNLRKYGSAITSVCNQPWNQGNCNAVSTTWLPVVSRGTFCLSWRKIDSWTQQAEIMNSSCLHRLFIAAPAMIYPLFHHQKPAGWQAHNGLKIQAESWCTWWEALRITCR